MKTELKRILQPYFTQLEETDKDLIRISQTQNHCITSRKYNGCWNCEKKEEDCGVTQSRIMVEARRKILYMRITNKVKEWISNAE